jgi:hypothetical protein
MRTLTIQFLEPNSRIQNLSQDEVVQKLHRAGQLLSITHVLTGSQLPESIEEACRKETERMGAKFYRWQPYLTSDGSFVPRYDWLVENLLGVKVKGYLDLPEFTHICPNNHAAMDETLKHLETIVATEKYDGIFLDRIRYPSPSQGFPDDLGCFCDHCIEAASKQGLDLNQVRQILIQGKNDISKATSLFAAVFVRDNSTEDSQANLLKSFFIFRRHSITQVVSEAARLIHRAGREVGLDCFSPSLANLVGQDLNYLGESADWIKIMTYARTMAPAGLPFELRGLLDFVVSPLGVEEKIALHKLEELSGIVLPSHPQEFELRGFSPLVLQKEIERGIRETRAPILAGIELVEDPKVIPLNETGWGMHMDAIKQANPAGLSISWDLMKISDLTLKSFSRIYKKLWK